jgi:hypothetical protein
VPRPPQSGPIWTPASASSILTGNTIAAQHCKRPREQPCHVHSKLKRSPEIVKKPMGSWPARATVETLYVKPGSLWQNAYAESFNTRMRGQLLEQEPLNSVEQAKLLSKRWSREYNHKRPPSAPGHRTPAEYAAKDQTLITTGT